MLPQIRRIKDITKLEDSARGYVRGSLGGEQSKKDCASCPQTVWINVFFDGTGNNFHEDGEFIYADPKQSTQSNISKLAFFAWPEKSPKDYLEDKAKATYRIYVPGVGTPFPTIGDTGSIRTHFINRVC